MFRSMEECLSIKAGFRTTAPLCLEGTRWQKMRGGCHNEVSPGWTDVITYTAIELSVSVSSFC